MEKRILSFKELNVYQLAFELQQEIFKISKSFPADERFSLTDQVRRSSRAIGANISEAWQKRRYITHFISKLTNADGEQAENQHWIGTAKACAYISEQAHTELLEKCTRIGQMLGSMMAKPEKFCHQ
jgi:four helix bundle protein